MAESANVAAWAFQGIELCRQGQWERGLDMLAKAAESDDRSSEGPSLMYSYLGYGIARYKGRPRDGVALCEHAVKIEFFQPDNQFNLARTYLLVGNREKAVAALRRGLKLDPDHGGLRALATQMGQRRRPVLRFLSRDHALNRFLGRLRHQISEPNTALEGEAAASVPKRPAAKAPPGPAPRAAPGPASKTPPDTPRERKS
ncbi:MAG TPA: tetratricopeptide repeat protein [Thermoanaerobaculia bacterium]|nr:tetratricopeptide repeat protein [Thermoanaerobaculia bacterium]